MLTPYNVLETVRNEIQAEHTLISHRITWFVTSQAFLMAAYAVSLGKGHQGVVFFRHAVPWLSVVLSFLSGLSVGCAIDAQWYAIKLQAEILQRMKAAALNGTCNDREMLGEYMKITCSAREGKFLTHWLAMTPPFLTPGVFAVLWVIAYRWSLSAAGIATERTHLAWRYLCAFVVVAGIFALLAGYRWQKSVREVLRESSKDASSPESPIPTEEK